MRLKVDFFSRVIKEGSMQTQTNKNRVSERRRVDRLEGTEIYEALILNFKFSLLHLNHFGSILWNREEGDFRL